MIEKISHWLTRRPKLIATIAVLLLIPSLIGAVATGINYDILSYLPQDLDSSQGEQLLEEPFHAAATSMLVVEKMPPRYTENLLRGIQDIDGVSKAFWVSDAMGIQIPTDMLPDDLRDAFFAGEATMMVIQYEKGAATGETMDAIDEVRALSNENCFLAGFSTIIKDTKDLMDHELPMFVGLAVLLALVSMSLTLDSWVLPFVFMADIGLAIAYNFGTNLFMGQISYVTQAIAAVLQLGVTMDYSIFLYRRYEEEREKYDDHKDAMSIAIQAAFSSLSGSSLTTIAGFLALCFMRLTLGADIGIVMAKGVVLGILTVIFVLPSFLLIFDKPINQYRHKALQPNFKKINQSIIKHRYWYVALFVILFLPAVYAQNHAELYYKLDESLPRDLPCIVANEKLKDEFDMATSHFIVMRDDLSAGDMKHMADEINDVAGVEGTISYNTLVGKGIPDFFVPEELRDMLKQEGYQLVMVNSSCETASTAVSAQLKEIGAIVKSYDPDAYVTGEAAMTDDLIETSAVDFKVTNYISIAAIFLIILLTFRSLTIPIALVASIELAIFINQGIPYFSGTVIPFVSPTVIGCVQLGATVDYAILMTTRFREEIRLGKNRKEAILIASTTSDSSIITSSLVMFCATLGVSMVSSIEIIQSICLMLARGSLISAVVSIFILPSVLCVCEPVFAKTSLHWSTGGKKHRALSDAESQPALPVTVPATKEVAEPSDQKTPAVTNKKRWFRRKNKPSSAQPIEPDVPPVEPDVPAQDEKPMQPKEPSTPDNNTTQIK